MKNLRYLRLGLFGLGLFSLAICTPSLALPLVLLLWLACSFLLEPSSELRTTLSVPEILMDVLDAFKTELVSVGLFSTNFSSKTAVLGDKITAHIALLPTTQDYNPTTGFAASATAAEDLVMDVPVTLSRFKHVPTKAAFLTQLTSKLPLYRECIRNIAYVLVKYVTDDALSLVNSSNFTHAYSLPPSLVSLEYLEDLRSTMNGLKMAGVGRFGIVNSAFANAIQADSRVGSKLFYSQLNGAEGYRRYKNLVGVDQVIEYPDLPGNGEFLSGFFGDRRSFAFASRPIGFANVAEVMQVPKVMDFLPLTDDETGLTLTMVTWQQPGTGDLFASVGMLWGVAAGNQGGMVGALTDNAGIRVTSQ